jgi:hypothetical protein
MTTEKSPKSPKYYYCEKCEYGTSNKKDYNKHLMTLKHEKSQNYNKNNKKNNKSPKLHEDPEKYNFFACECGKKYPYRASLFNHRKKCNKKSDNIDLKELVIKLMTDNQEIKKENQKLMQQMCDLIPKVGNNNNTINNKQRFNINVFLNEKCKDALTMKEFIDKIEVSMENLLTTRDKGLGDGLASIIMDNMNKLSVYERPIHCTDKKRETVYVKNDEWKRDETRGELNRLVRTVENKQIKNINQWTDEHPDYMENDKLQEEYIDLMRGCTSSIDACKDKVIRKVCDKVYVSVVD